MPASDGDRPRARRARRESITVSFEARDYLAEQEVAEELVSGATNAVTTCLAIQPAERVILVVEQGLQEIGAALLQAADRVGAEVTAYVVDGADARNEAFVTRLEARLGEADASLLVASVDGLPKPFRRRMLVGGDEERRHAHMVGITPAMMKQSMRADYGEVDALGRRLCMRLGPESTLRIETTTGTALVVRAHPQHRWHNASGLLRGRGWVNLPGGEVITAPQTVDGVLVPDGGVWVGTGEEVTRPGRLRLTFERGELVDVAGPEDDVRAILEAVDVAPNGRRVGQIGLGTNTSVLTSIGSLLQDLKMPGVHLTLGYTAPEQTGAAWTSEVEIPLIVRRPDARLDGVPLLVRGRYARDLTET